MDKEYTVEFDEFSVVGNKLPSKDEIQKYFVQ
jgi:hypothetical protein